MRRRALEKFLVAVFTALSLSIVLPAAAPAVQPSPATPAGETAASAEKTLWIISHTHWEGAVFKTREEYLEIGLPHILTALRILQEHPEYRFVLDQVAYVKPFLERYPEEVATFHKFVSEGRLQIVGGNDVMLDVNIPSGESWIRQALYGKGYYKDELGVDVTVGWGLDTFGHHAQMPQLLKLAGYKSYWFQRGVHGMDTPSEFLWQGLDGTRIPAFWLPLGYGLFMPAPGNAFEYARYSEEQWKELGKYSRWPDRVALAGADVSEPEESLPGLVKQFDQTTGAPFTLRFGVPTDYEAAIARRPDRPVISGELNPVFQGVYSTRIELKQWVRRLENVLTNAEKLTAVASALGTGTTWMTWADAWEPVLFNQAHDLMSGTMVDKVYEETIHAYQSSQVLGGQQVESALDAIAGKIDTRGEGVPVAVFNTLGWPRTDLAQVEVGSIGPGFTALTLRDPSGKNVPLQLLETERYGDGSIKDAKVAFIARDVPALGYAVYRIVPTQAAASAPPESARETSSTMHEDEGSIENEFYRLKFDLWTGAMKQLIDKTSGWEVLSGAGNVVAREEDGGDFWELYGTLNGARLTAMTRRQGLPPAARTRYSDEQVGGSGATTVGPVFSEFHISHPFGNGDFATTVRLYPGIRRIDIQTQLLNNDKFVRYRVLFPTSLREGQRFDEIPFGAIERPIAQEFPAQYWMDYSDGNHGLALLTRGLPGNNVADGALMLSLLRSARISAYPFIGGYEAGVSSDLGLELNLPRTFDYALVPHTGDWRGAEVYRAGWDFNHPLLARKLAAHEGSLPARWGLLEISQPGVVVSALKPSGDGKTVLRVYEAAGKPASGVEIKFTLPIDPVFETSLLEHGGQRVQVENNAWRFDLHPFEIKTFKLALRARGSGQ